MSEIDQQAWLGAFRRAADRQRLIFDEIATQAERTRYEGVGEGGDHSLVIDRQAEQVVFEELEALHGEGHRFRVVSEERGEVDMGANSPVVVIDPIDGSLNARRTLPGHSLSIAVASGPTMADVDLGYVLDFGSREEYVAAQGRGARRDGRPISVPEAAGLEVVGLESASPEAILPLIEGLRGRAFRLRVVGSVAITLCRVASGALDAMACGRDVRSVDAAAAQLIVREAGGSISFGRPPEEASLDLEARYPLVATRSAGDLATLEEVAGIR